MLIWRLPLLALNSGETKRLSAGQAQLLLGCRGDVKLPWGLSLDQAWSWERLSKRFIVYWEKVEGGAKGKFTNKFRLTESIGKNNEVVLDEGKAGALIDCIETRQDAHTFFWAKSPKIDQCTFVLPLHTTDWYKWPEIPGEW